MFSLCPRQYWYWYLSLGETHFFFHICHSLFPAQVIAHFFLYTYISKAICGFRKKKKKNLTFVHWWMRLHDPHMPTVKAEFFECSHVLPSGIKVCHFIWYMWLCSYRSQKESRPVWSEEFKGGGGLIWVSLRWSDQGPHEAGGEAVWPGFISWIRAEGERGESVIKLEKAGVWKKSLVWPHIWTCVPYWSSFHCVCGSLTCLNFTEVEDRSTQKLHFLFRSVDH